MKIIKLDRRFRYYPEFEQALRYNFLEHNQADRIIEWLKNTHGSADYWDHNQSPPRHIINPMWRTDKKRRRIYVKNQADISMALLIASG